MVFSNAPRTLGGQSKCDFFDGPRFSSWHYRGPGAPAAGPRHHYTFELYALDTKLDIQPGTDGFETRVTVIKAIQGHILGKAVYMGLFHRPQ